MHPRQKLPKLKLTSDIEESANRILNEYLHGDENIPEITDKVYAMEKATGIKSKTGQKEILVQKINPQMETGQREN